jgi:hypothetical protein
MRPMTARHRIKSLVFVRHQGQHYAGIVLTLTPTRYLVAFYQPGHGLRRLFVRESYLAPLTNEDRQSYCEGLEVICKECGVSLASRRSRRRLRWDNFAEAVRQERLLRGRQSMSATSVAPAVADNSPAPGVLLFLGQL